MSEDRHSESNSGSTEGEAHARPKAASSPAGEKFGDRYPLRIAVAEDNSANQRVLMMMLRRLGWEATFCSNGLELLEYLRDHSVDLIFMDLQMPVMDGLEASSRIRSGEAGESLKSVKIMALTANALRADEKRCLIAGMDSYITKPISVASLRARIMDLFPEMQGSDA